MMKWLEIASRTAILLVLVIIVLVFLKVEIIPPPEPEPIRYEYKVIAPSDFLLDTELSRLGRKGWQVVFARRAMSVLDIASYEIILMREGQ